LGLKEIFERKEQLDEKLLKLKSEQSNDILEKEITNLGNIIKNLVEQLLDEINNYKEYRENDLQSIFEKFFSEKHILTTDIFKIYNNK